MTGQFHTIFRQISIHVNACQLFIAEIVDSFEPPPTCPEIVRATLPVRPITLRNNPPQNDYHKRIEARLK